jgi:hypothetical protein
LDSRNIEAHSTPLNSEKTNRPVLSEKNNEEAVDCRRDLAEMGYIWSTLNLDSPRFLSKAAKVAYCQIDADRSPGSRSDQKVAEVSE